MQPDRIAMCDPVSIQSMDLSSQRCPVSFESNLYTGQVVTIKIVAVVWMVVHDLHTDWEFWSTEILMAWYALKCTFSSNKHVVDVHVGQIFITVNS